MIVLLLMKERFITHTHPWRMIYSTISNALFLPLSLLPLHSPITHKGFHHLKKYNMVQIQSFKCKCFSTFLRFSFSLLRSKNLDDHFKTSDNACNVSGAFIKYRLKHRLNDSALEHVLKEDYLPEIRSLPLLFNLHITSHTGLTN